MMKTTTLATAMAILFCAGGCRQTEKDMGQDTVSDSLQTELPKIFYGHLGENTGMSSLELITDNGDTLSLSKADENNGTYGLILGCITNYTDRYAVTTDDSCTFMLQAVNLSQLSTEWTSPHTADYMLRIIPDGRVEIQGNGIPPYTSWTLDGNFLLLHRTVTVSEPRMATTATDTAEILSLCTDSMQLSFKGDRYETLYHTKKAE